MNLLKPLINLFHKPKEQEEEEYIDPEIPTDALPLTKQGAPSHKVGRISKTALTNKHTEEQKLFIVSMIGQGSTSEEIKEAFHEKYNISIYRPGNLVRLYKNSPKWKPIIAKLQAKFYEEVESVAGYHKRVRLERAEKAYDRAVKKGDIKNQLAATEHQRKEVEQGNFSTLSLTLNQYNTMSSEELLAEKERLLAVLKNYNPRQIDKLDKPKEVQDGQSRVQDEEWDKRLDDAEGP